MSMQNLNWVDYIIIAIFIFSILGGLSRGLVKEVVSLATIVAAFIIASMFASPVAAMFTSSQAVQNVVSQASGAIGANASQPVSYIALGISFLLIFIVVNIVGSIISSILSIAVQAGMLGVGNRILGGAFGVLKGYIVTLVFIFIVQLTPLGSQTWWVQSQLVQEFQPSVQWLANLVSPSLANLKNTFNQTLQNVNSSLQQMATPAGGYIINNQ